MLLRVVVGTSVGAALLVTTGCMVERTYQPPDSNNDFVQNRFEDRDDFVVDDGDDFDDGVYEDDGDFVGRWRSVEDGTMVGDVGPAVGINQTPDRLGVYDDGYYVSVESVAQLPDRAAMLMLSVANGADLFVPGTSRTFTIYEYDEYGPQVTLLGCTGQEMDVYDEYDVPADEVDVVVEEGEVPGEVVVQVAGRWSSYEYDEYGNPVGAPQTASATFTLQQ